MTENELYNLLDLWENIELLTKEIIQNPKEFNVLMSVALHHPKPKSWRAAYLVDKIHDEVPEMVIPYLPAIIKKVGIDNNASKRRHWLKLISMNPIDKSYFGFLFDFCIKIFTSAKEAIA